MNGDFSLLHWLAEHPQAYLAPVAALLLLGLGLAATPIIRGQPPETRSDWAWGVLLLLILLVGRWPSFLMTRELSFDESQMLAGAHALTHDPVFWRSVNGGTAGPLNFFALWPAGWLCGWNTFLTARLTALVLLGLTFAFIHQVMALTLSRVSARLASLAVVALEALTHSPDLLHYSTELVSIALLSVAAYAAVRRWLGPGGPEWCGLGGLMLGALPFAKTQAVPLGAAFGLGWLWAELCHSGPAAPRRRALLLLGALLPSALFLWQIFLAGVWPTFVLCYLGFNLTYAASSLAGSYGELFALTLRAMTISDGLLVAAFAGFIVWLAALLRLRPVPIRAVNVVTWTALIGCIVALGSILVAKRPYLHYWQLLVVPGSGLLAALIARTLLTAPPHRRNAERWLVVLCAVGFVGTLLGYRARHPHALLGSLAYFQRVPLPTLSARVAAYAQPGESLAIWGLTDHVYVETGLRQATLNSHYLGMVQVNPQLGWNRARFMQDLKHSPPETFLDSSGPESVFQAARSLRHEALFPELAAWIRTHYVLVEEVNQARIYRRKDLAPP